MPRKPKTDELIPLLAEELGIPGEYVTVAYRSCIARLESVARIREFIPLIAATQVRRALRRSSPETNANAG